MTPNRKRHDMIVRVPDLGTRKWISIDDLKKIEVDVRMIRRNNRSQKAGRYTLADLLLKTR